MGLYQRALRSTCAGSGRIERRAIRGCAESQAFMSVGITSRGWCVWVAGLFNAECAERRRAPREGRNGASRADQGHHSIARRAAAAAGHISILSARSADLCALCVEWVSRQPHRPRQFHHGMKRRRAEVPSRGNGDRTARSRWPAHIVGE